MAGEENAQQIIAQEEKNKTTRRLILLGVVILGAVFYFVWQNYLNFGYIEIKGDAPYSVFVFDDKTYDCPANPCELKLKRGEKDLIFSKPGYSARSAEVEVALWNEVSINVLFKLNPSLSEISAITETQTTPQTKDYEMKYDDEHHNWKLIEKNDEHEYPISYFAEKLKDPIIVGTNDSVLIIENQIYFINILTKQREELGIIKEEIQSVTPSYNGEYFLIHATQENQNVYYIAENDKLIKPLISPDPKNIKWTYFTDLAVAYEDDAKLTINITSPKTLEERLLVEETILGDKMSLEEFFPSSKAKKIYFKVGETSYEITY